MKMNSIFKKSAVFAIAMALVLLMAISVVPMVSAADEVDVSDYYEIKNGDTDHGETLSAMNVSLSGKITMMFYFTGIDDSFTKVKITVPTEDEDVNNEYYLNYNDASVDENGRYVVKVSVAAAQQTKLVSLQWFQGENGGKIRAYSVKYYAETVMDLAKTDNAKYGKMVQPVKSMLNYGALAQTRFGYNTNDLANKGHYDEANNPINNMDVTNLYDAVAKNLAKSENIEFFGVQAFLQDDVRLRIYVDAPEGATAQVNGTDVTIKPDANGSYIGIYNIPATKFADVFTITVTNGDETATAEYSVLAWCLDTLGNYKESAANKDLAKSLYLYYTWMKGYTDDNYVPGLKDEEGNTACTHLRSHLEGDKVVCSDCGHDEYATQVSLSADVVSLRAGEATNVTFTISVAGTVDLQSLVITLKCYDENGNEVENALSYVDNSLTTNDKWQGEAALNVVIDSEDVVTEAGELATVTYTVTVPNAGNYKIVPVIREATNGADAEIPGTILASSVAINVKPASCETHAYTYVITEDTHTAYCDVCETIWDAVAHTYTESYTDKGNVRTYTSACVCGKEKHTFDINVGEVKPNVVWTATDIMASAKAESSNLGVVTISNDGSYITFNTHASVKSEGYFRIFQGSKTNSDNPVTGQYLLIKYRTTRSGNWQFFGSANYGVNSAGAAASANFTVGGSGSGYINDGEWQTLIIDLSSFLNKSSGSYFTKEEGDGYRLAYLRWDIFDENNGNGTSVDVAYIAMADNLKALGDLDPYEGEELLEGYTKSDATTYTGTPLGIPYNSSTENIYFTPSKLASLTSIADIVIDEETGVPFARYTSNKTGSEVRLNLWANEYNPLTKNVGTYAAIVYRKPAREASEHFDFFLSSNLAGANGTANIYRNIKTDGEWHFMLLDTSAIRDTSKASYFTPDTQIMSLVFDAFNDTVATGDTVDVAYIAMFDSAEEAYEYYEGFRTLHGLECNHDVLGNWEFIADEERPGLATEQGTCLVCGEKPATRSAKFKFNFDGLYGYKDGKDNAVIATGGKTSNVWVLDNQYTKLGGYLTGSGWMGINGLFADHFMFRVFDSEGNLISDGWQSVSIDRGDALAASNGIVTSVNNEKFGFTSDPRRFTMSNLNLLEWAKYDNVTVELAAVAESAPEGYDLIPFLKFTNLHIQCPHTDATTWTPIIENDGNADGVLYEEKICPNCEKQADVREAAYKANIDNVKINTGSWIKRATYLANTAAYNVDVYRVGLGGWFACNGGTYKYVYRVTDEEGNVSDWVPASATTWNLNMAEAGKTTGSGPYISAIENAGYGLKDYAKNVGFTGGNFTADLQDYIGQTVTVEFGAIPQNNQGLADAPNVIKFYTLTDIGGEQGIVCDHSRNTDENYAFDADNPQKFSVNCSVCDEKVYKEATTTDKGLLFFGPELMKSKTGSSLTPTVETDESGMSYVRVTATKTSGEETSHIFSNTTNPATNLGKYIAIVYRNSGTNEQIQLVCEGKLSSVQAGVINCPNTAGGTDWKIAIVETKTFSGTTSAGAAYGYDGTQLTAFRVDYFNNSRAVGDTVDVAFIAFFNNPAEAATYFSNYVNAYEGLEYNCTHSADLCSATWSSADKLYYNVCNACGKDMGTSDMIYKTESNSTAGAGSSGNFLTVSTGTDTDGETYVRYTANSSASDPYLYVFSTGGTVKTGNYMVIKYRFSNNGTNGTVERLFSGSLASGRSSASGSDYSYCYSTTLYADGEWHYMVIHPQESNAAFVANADGTYNWRYLRMNVKGWAATNNTCYLDIAELAFAADAEAAEYYAYKNDPENTPFTVNFDNGNNTLNGATFLGAAKQKTGVYTMDMSQYAALETPTSLKLGGWVCTPGGVKYYKIRVTNIDDVAVENPTLVDWYTGIYRNDIYTGAGKAKGYSNLCANGAGMGYGTVVDLTAYAGHTVDFEIVVITNFGAEIVVTEVINVAVPAAE